jgi:hypothetical protein
MKICSKCNRSLEFSYFGKDKATKDGLRHCCKDCRREANKISCQKYHKNNKERLYKEKKEYYKENREYLLLQKKEYYQENKEKLVQDKRDYREKYPEKNKESLRKSRLNNLEKSKERDKEYYYKNREKRLSYQKEYALKNKEEISKRRKEYYKENYESLKEKRVENKPERAKKMRENRLNDDNFRMRCVISSSFSARLRRKNIKKDGSTFKYTGFKVKNYVDHLSRDPLWGKYFQNSGEVHLDHIIPCSLYDHRNPEEIKKCWDPRNLRFLSAKDNMEKSNKLDLDLIKEHDILDLMPKKIAE